MANRFNNITTVISATDSVMVNSTYTLFAQIIATDQAICGELYLQSKLTTGSASQKYDVYAVCSEDGVIFEDANVANNKLIGTVNFINDTGTYHIYRIPLDGLSVVSKYMKIALLPASASAGTILAGSMKTVIRSPK